MTSACYWTQFANILLTTVFVLMCMCIKLNPAVFQTVTWNNKLAITANIIHPAGGWYKFYHPFYIFLTLQMLFLVFFYREFSKSNRPELYWTIVGLSFLNITMYLVFILVWNFKTTYPTTFNLWFIGGNLRFNPWPRPLGIITLSIVMGIISLAILIANESMVVAMLS